MKHIHLECLLLLAIALLADRVQAQPAGSIVGWGSRILVVPAALGNIVSLAAGYHHTVGLKADGTLVAWGHNNRDVCRVPEPNSGFVAVAAGWVHNLGLKADGSVVGWGDN